MRYEGGKHIGVVTVDGVEVRDVVECDTDLGFAVVHVRDDAGQLIIKDGKVMQRIVLGLTTFTPTLLQD